MNVQTAGSGVAGGDGHAVDEPTRVDEDQRRAEERLTEGGKATSVERNEMFTDTDNQRRGGESGAQAGTPGREVQSPVGAPEA